MKSFNEFINESKNTKGKLKLVFVGDIMQHQKKLDYQETAGFTYEGIFDNIKFIFNDADIIIGNLETTFSGDFGNKMEDGNVYFSANDNLAKALKETGFTHLSVYNNHSFDYGYPGHQRTIQILEDAKLEVLQSQKIYTLGDYKVEIANFTTHVNNKEISDSDLSSITNTNPIADISADFNIAYVHWGGQYTENEIQEQKKIAEFLKIKGYEIIIGSGPHTVHDVIFDETDKGNVIAYSLGDFIADHKNPIAKNEGMVLSIEINDNQITYVNGYNTKTEDTTSIVNYISKEYIL